MPRWIPHISLLLALAAIHAQNAGALSVPDDPQEALALGRHEKNAGVRDLNKARAGGNQDVRLARSAMKHFENAQRCYEFYLDNTGENPKVEEEMSELQSLLYWCRKMTPLREEDEPPAPPEPEDVDTSDPDKPDPTPPPAAKEPEPVEPPQPSPGDMEKQAREMFDGADAFAKANPDDHMQILARFFHIADAFRGTPWATQALERCIALQERWRKEEAEKAAAAGTPEKEPEPVDTDATTLRLRLRHPDPEKRSEAYRVLVEVTGKWAVPDLHEAFLTEKDESVRKTVFDILVDLRDRRTLDKFPKFAAEKDPVVCRDLMRLIAAMGKERDVRYMLYAILYNEERLTAPYEARVGRSLDSYVSRVQSAYNSGLRKLMIETLAKNEKWGVKGLEMLFSTRGACTREAILALGAWGQVKSARKLVIYLARGRAGIYRGEAMAAFKMLGEDAIPYLISVLGNSSQKIWAAWLLRDMTGKQWGGHPAKWAAWWKQHKRGR